MAPAGGAGLVMPGATCREEYPVANRSFLDTRNSTPLGPANFASHVQWAGRRRLADKGESHAQVRAEGLVGGGVGADQRRVPPGGSGGHPLGGHAQDHDRRSILRRRGARREPGHRRRLRGQDPADRGRRLHLVAGRQRHRQGAVLDQLPRCDQRLDRRSGRPDPAQRRRRQDVEQADQRHHRSICSPSTSSTPTTDGRSATRRPTCTPPTAARPGWLGKIGGDEKLTADEALLAQEPVLYDVQFLDRQDRLDRRRVRQHLPHHRRRRDVEDAAGVADRRRGHLRRARHPDLLRRAPSPTRTNGVAAGLETKIARTRDGGAKWKFDEIDIKDATGDPLYQPFLFPDATGWAVGAAGDVVQQRSPGEPWQRVSLGHGGEHLAARRVLPRPRDDGWIVGGFGTSCTPRTAASRGCRRSAERTRDAVGDSDGPRLRRSQGQAPALLAGRQADRLPPPGVDRRPPGHRAVRLLGLPAPAGDQLRRPAAAEPPVHQDPQPLLRHPSAAPTTS